MMIDESHMKAPSNYLNERGGLEQQDEHPLVFEANLTPALAFQGSLPEYHISSSAAGVSTGRSFSTVTKPI